MKNKYTQKKVSQVKEIMGVGTTTSGTTNKNPNLCVSSSSSPPCTSSSSSSSKNGGQNEIESHRSTVFSADSVFGSVPTPLEIEYAIAAFQSFMMQGLSSPMSKLDPLPPLLNNQDPTILQSTGFQRVYDAFCLLHSLPSVQRMVKSISCDTTVWDAVMRNNEVQKFQSSLKQAEARRLQGCGIEPDFLSMNLRWILDNIKLQFSQVIKTLKSLLLVTKSFESPQNENSNTEVKKGFEEMILLSVLLSTITLMIVLVTRACGA